MHVVFFVWRTTDRTTDREVDVSNVTKCPIGIVRMWKEDMKSRKTRYSLCGSELLVHTMDCLQSYTLSTNDRKERNETTVTRIGQMSSKSGRR